MDYENIKEGEGVIKFGKDSLAIINGGNAIKDCPTDWDEANKWIEESNGDKEKFDHPLWSFDCGFKLDFDGPFISVNSRFYPPKTFQGDTWDGGIEFCLLGKHLTGKSFDCETLDELKKEVESYVSEMEKKFKELFDKIETSSE